MGRRYLRNPDGTFKANPGKAKRALRGALRRRSRLQDRAEAEGRRRHKVEHPAGYARTRRERRSDYKRA